MQSRCVGTGSGMQLSTCTSALHHVHKGGTVQLFRIAAKVGTSSERTRSCSPGHLSLSVSRRETTWFLECGFLLHPMANSVIRAVSSVKGLNREQRHLFLGALGQCLAPYQVPDLLVVFIFHTQNAKGGSFPWGGGGEQNDGKTECVSGRSSWNGMCCLVELSSVVLGVNQSLQARPHHMPWWHHLQAQGIWAGRCSHRTMGPVQQRALASSPPERWVSLPARRWKVFVSGKGWRLLRQASCHSWWVNPGEGAPGSEASFRLSST